MLLAFVFLAPKDVKESFRQSQFVIPEKNDALSSYYTPDLDWVTFQANMKQQMKPTPSKQKSDAQTVEADAESDAQKAKTDVESGVDQIESEVSSFFERPTQAPTYTTDQRYILQKQKSAPRFIPTFPKKSFLVYDPKDPPLRYATRPGPNSLDDILSEAAHIETPKETKLQNEAQKSAQERHEDLLRRTNWIFHSANRYNSDRILKQPKMIPGPSNEDKYKRRYSHYGLA